MRITIQIFKNIVRLLIIVLCFASCSFHRVGDLTVVSTRNFDSNEKYVLLKSGVSAKAKSRRGDALDQAIDNATALVSGGEFLKNVKIYTKPSGRKIKVVGDVWGTSSVQTEVKISVTDTVSLSIGDRVSFEINSSRKTGIIIGINPSTALIEYPKAIGNQKNVIDLGFNEIVKIEP